MTKAEFWAKYKKHIMAVALMLSVLTLGFLLRLDKTIVTAFAALVGLATSAFSSLTALIVLIPWAGPLIVKALSLPIIWLMNGAGYFTAIFLAKRGHGKAVVDSRLITIVLIVGIIIGFIIGKIL
jgi:uncharacterized membrane protein